MKPLDGASHLLVTAIVGAAWLLGKIESETALPALFVLSGVVAVPSAIKAAKSGGTPPTGVVLALLSPGVISVLAKISQIAVILMVAIGFSACSPLKSLICDADPKPADAGAPVGGSSADDDAGVSQ